MMLTGEQTKVLANNIVNRVVADLMEHDKVRQAIDKVRREDWAESLDYLYESVESILLNSYGCT